MAANKQHSFLALFLILVLCINLLGVQPALAQGEVPTEPPAATEVETEPPTGLPTEVGTEAATDLPAEPTGLPVEETPVPFEHAPIPAELTPEPVLTEPTSTPIAEILTQIPESTEVVVLDETGTPVPLAAQEAVDITELMDPMWCPANVLPGGPGCSVNYTGPNAINNLINNMITNPSFYDENGVIYFTATAGSSLNLTSATLGGSYNTLSNFNLTLQGGWNGQNGASATFNGTTSFGSSSVTIGTAANPWVGNITVNNFSFNGVSSTNALTVYTTNGDITLNNVDVAQQSGGNHTALLDSDSGDIMVQNGSTFDGNNGFLSSNQGFSATTTTGAINITGTSSSQISFTDAGALLNNYNGATLNAPTVTLTYVTASNNDSNGLSIFGGSLVTLNNVTASGNSDNGISIVNASTVSANSVTTNDNDDNGILITNTNFVNLNNVTSASNSNGLGNGLSGVLVNGTGSKIVSVAGGTFADNGRYGVEVVGGSIFIRSNPNCPTTGSTRNGIACYSPTPLTDASAPVITRTISGTSGANGWYTSDVTVSWTISDPQSGILSSSGCTPTTLTNETSGTAVTCTATNGANATSTDSVTIKIDKSAPTAALSITGGTQGANSWYTSDVTVRTSGVDSRSGVTCTADQILSSETTGTVVNGSCTNGAGLTTHASPLTIKLDKTAPVTTLSVTAGTAGANGWYTSDVTVHTSGVESTSSPVTCTADQAQSAETAGTSVNGSCTNQAGLTSNASPLNLKLDKTNPTIAFTGRTAPNVNGWNNTNVTVDWSCDDSLSGPASATVSQTVTTEGADQSATGTCADQAGNTASDTQGGINIDKTAPSLTLPSNITAEATSNAGASVTYSASVTDNLDANITLSCVPASGATFSLGLSKVHCSSTDHADNAAHGSFTILVQDTTGPVIADHPGETVEATSAAGAIVTYANPAATDAVDGPVEVTCLPASGTQFVFGNTTVNCQASDQHENTSTSSFVVHVVDTTAPAIAFHPDITEEATGLDGALVNYTNPTANDLVDGPVHVNCAPVSGTQFALGDTTVNCEATDQHENTATSSFIIHVVDSTAPVIAPHADETAEATSPAGAVVTYTTPSASDAVDPVVTVTCSPASGTTFAVGNTSVTCNAMDSHENMAIPVTFTVHVVDTTDPVLDLPATITANAIGPAGVVVTFTASATDIVDSTVPVSCIPASGSTFPLGVNIVDCAATDAHGNTATGSFIINVQDPDAPILSLPADIIAEATGPNGAVVNFSVSAADVVDGSIPVTCSHGSGSTFGLGDTTVTCSATDKSGNSNSAAFLVTVQDTTAPAIAPQSNLKIGTRKAFGAVISYTSPATTDAVDGPGTATCTPASGSFFPMGNTTVTCTATDAHGNTSEISFVINVYPAERPTVSVSTSSGFLIPLTGGELVDLDCNSVFWTFGIKLSFINLCDYQTTVHQVVASDLPAELPEGASFVLGLQVDLLHDENLVEELPAGAGIELDFPTYDQPLDQFAVLFWDDADGDGKGEWVEITQSLLQEDISQTLNAEDGLYHLDAASAADLFYKILTTHKTGVFVLVQK